MDEQRAALLRAVADFSDSDWTRRPAADRWSVGDVCEHLHRVERGCARLVAKRGAEAREAGHPAETEDGSVLESLAFARLDDRSDRREAPERVAPEGGWSREAALAALEHSRAELRGAIAAADGLALQSVRHEHPRLGDIDLYQWILFVGAHEARHLSQIVEIRQALPREPDPSPRSTTSAGDA